ncbi:MAG: tripartite tricarboxylate transporter substrate-binding protein [Alphaproteobacteria bacterium]|jgi:tripartite-type tricarboxylate transporter receptor subunit TctC|nr:transporter [Rhodospirillaceae bacterium]MDP6405909.1 tripartite tricarboxylate transporter substrate-binding protein [Alphaproteobacteria bacterium]|tara:strand:- start:2643 stop:3590 length:948 start_codon:yes stop_codon:yes gene_type:complete
MRSIVLSAFVGAALVMALPAGPAQAEYPNKPVSFVVPFPPGDLEDVLTRLIAENFQAKYGIAAAVVNKPGGGGGPFPGAVEVAKAPADGSVIGSFVIGVPTVGPLIGIPELKPNPFEPLGIFLTYPFVLATKGDAPYKDIAGLAKHAQSNDVALGHFGAVLIPTKVSFALAKKKGFKWASEAAFDALDCNTLASGDVDVINTTLQLILPCLDKVTVLASITGKRISKTPNAPTVSEIEPTLDISLWNGLFVHKDTPAEVRQKIIVVAKETVLGAKAQKIAADTGAQVYWMDAQASTGQIAKDNASIAAIGKLLGE